MIVDGIIVYKKMTMYKQSEHICNLHRFYDYRRYIYKQNACILAICFQNDSMEMTLDHKIVAKMTVYALSIGKMPVCKMTVDIMIELMTHIIYKGYGSRWNAILQNDCGQNDF